MNLDFSEEQKLLRETARDFLAEKAPLSLCRQVLEDESQDYARELWSELGEMGWLGTAVPEELGGAGYGPIEVALLCEELGRALAPVPFGSSVTLATEALLLAGSAEQRERLLPKLASGEEIGTLAAAEQAGPVAPDSLGTTLKSGQLTGSKCAVPDGGVARRCIVLAVADGRPALALVDLDGPGVSREATASLDPSRPVARLHFDGAPAEPVGALDSGWELFEALRERAAILQAFEQIGAAQRALELTLEFTLERYAFGRPVASYQALKHRLADLYVAIELARSHAYYGAWAITADVPERSEAACSARIAACQAFEQATAEMIQMHGGVGYTWEYDCQLFYRRAKGLAASLGSPREWRQRLVGTLARPKEGQE